MRKTDLAYAAGIIDGEGCICINANHHPPSKNKRRRYYVLSVSVTSTDEWLCQWLKFSFGGSVQIKKRLPPKKNCWNWYVYAKTARQFLELIYPYLHLKKPQAEIAFNFQVRRGTAGIRKSDKDIVLDQADAILLKSLHIRKGM